MGRYKDSDVQEFCSRPFEELSAGQRRACRRLAATLVDDSTLDEAWRVLEDQPQLSVDRAVDAVGKLGPVFTHEAPVSDDGWLEEPPADMHLPKVGTRYMGFADALSAHEGKWRMFREVPSRKAAVRLAAGVRTGRLAAFRPAGDYEARAVENPVGTHQVWCRARSLEC